jgi:hypothetical protein
MHIRILCYRFVVNGHRRCQFIVAMLDWKEKLALALALFLLFSESFAVEPRQFNPSDFRRKHLSPPQDTTSVIFYNLYIPDEPKEAAREELHYSTT